LFAAWGLGAAALRIERHERPNWTAQYDRHLTGYNHEGEPPEAAIMETPWGTRERITIPLPPLPAAFNREQIPEQIQPRFGRWTIKRVNTMNPLEAHPWETLPNAATRTAEGMRSMLEEWISNPRSRGPKPFKWRNWYAAAERTWTEQAGAILGRRYIGQLGAALWENIEKPPDRFPDITHPEHIAHQLVRDHAQALRTARQSLSTACTPDERRAYLARMPESIRHHLEEICREQDEMLSWLH
jgi:hypothetical protein